MASIRTTMADLKMILPAADCPGFGLALLGVLGFCLAFEAVEWSMVYWLSDFWIVVLLMFPPVLYMPVEGRINLRWIVGYILKTALMTISIQADGDILGTAETVQHGLWCGHLTILPQEGYLFQATLF